VPAAPAGAPAGEIDVRTFGRQAEVGRVSFHRGGRAQGIEPDGACRNRPGCGLWSIIGVPKASAVRTSPLAVWAANDL
jgi:hypothetical protein